MSKLYIFSSRHLSQQKNWNIWRTEIVFVCVRERELLDLQIGITSATSQRERERVSLKAAVGRRMQDRGSIYKKFVIFILYFLFYYL